jgi:hypothetical protein
MTSEPCLVEIDGALALGLANERVIEVGPGHQCVSAISSEGWRRPSVADPVRRHCRTPPGSWKKNVKPRFSPQATSGRASLPGAPFREHADPRQVVTVGELLEQQVRQRRGRLADREPRVAALLNQRDAAARLSSASAVSEPAKPDPTIATSAST